MNFVIANARIFTGLMLLSPGFIRVENGLITSVGPGFPLPSDMPVIDAQGLTVFPGIVDCHTHLMEFASLGVEKALGKAQIAAGYANLLKAAGAGITTLGEHVLGHPLLNQPLATYQHIAANAPQTVKLCTGWCVVGTEPYTILSAQRPGETITPEDIEASSMVWLAQHSQFPGENIFITATPANLPAHLVPRAGQSFLSAKEVQATVDLFHSHGRKIGAHLEGDVPTREFILAGGDVVHHGHGISDDTLMLMAKKGCGWVVTPHGGTGAPPTTARQIAKALKLGIRPALASDSYLPMHPAAANLSRNLPGEKEIGPGEFMTIIHNLSHELQQFGVSATEILQMLTLYPAEILGLEHVVGSIDPGKQADLVVAKGLWGIEITHMEEVLMVFSQGDLIIDRRQ